MKEQDYKFYSELRIRSISMNSVSKIVKKSSQFNGLFESKILGSEKAGRGSKIIIRDLKLFEAFFSKHFSDDEIEIVTKSSNIKKFRDSKAKRAKSDSIFFLRGFIDVIINGEIIDLSKFTNIFGLFSTRNPTFKAEKICFVENLESFFNADKLFGNEFIYLHKYGRIGIQSIKDIYGREVIVFVDYDFNGLDEYLRIKNVYKNAILFIPENFDELFEKYSKSIDGKQQPSKRVLESEIFQVIKLRELVLKTNRFLEQEILTND